MTKKRINTGKRIKLTSEHDKENTSPMHPETLLLTTWGPRYVWSSALNPSIRLSIGRGHAIGCGGYRGGGGGPLEVGDGKWDEWLPGASA